LFVRLNIFELGELLRSTRNIRVTNDHGYVTFVVINRSCPHSWLIRVCNKSNTTGVTCRAGYAYTFGAHVHPRILVGFALLYLLKIEKTEPTLFLCVVFCTSLWVLFHFSIVFSVLQLPLWYVQTSLGDIHVYFYKRQNQVYRVHFSVACDKINIYRLVSW